MKEPSAATLARYGLSLEEWRALLDRQGGVCSICHKPSDRLCIDHEHAKGWKKMPADQRKTHVRGLLCWFCNHYYVGRCITVEKAQNVVAYLSSYETGRLPGASPLRVPPIAETPT